MIVRRSMRRYKPVSPTNKVEPRAARDNARLAAKIAPLPALPPRIIHPRETPRHPKTTLFAKQAHNTNTRRTTGQALIR